MNLELSHYQKKDVSFGNIPSPYPALQVNKGAEEIVVATLAMQNWQRDEETKQKKMPKTEKEVEFVVIIEYVGGNWAVPSNSWLSQDSKTLFGSKIR